MPLISKEITGEDAREIANEIKGIDRFGYDGRNAYIFLKDKSIIMITTNGKQLKFFLKLQFNARNN